MPFEELPAERGLTTVEIVKAAAEKKIRGMLIMGENPLLTDPNSEPRGGGAAADWTSSWSRTSS